MFTGLIEEIGKIERLISTGKGIRLQVYGQLSTRELQVGDSVSINGVCQTVIGKGQNTFEVEAVEETLKKTTFGYLKVNDTVNLELPMKLQSRFGGHFVLGHVDCIGTVTSIERKTNSYSFCIEIPKEFLKYLIPRGSIAIDGVSLTIAEVQTSKIYIAVIPHTLYHTIFQFYKIGSFVNIEFDVIGKYIERLIQSDIFERNKKNFFTESMLRELGY